MYIPVQISGRFPDSGIHTGSSLPSQTASDRCRSTIAFLFLHHSDEIVQDLHLFPFYPLSLQPCRRQRHRLFLIQLCLPVWKAPNNFLYYSTHPRKRVGLDCKTVRIIFHFISIFYHPACYHYSIWILRRLCQQPDQYVRLLGLRGSAQTFLLPSFSFCKEKRRTAVRCAWTAFRSTERGILQTVLHPVPCGFQPSDCCRTTDCA